MYIGWKIIGILYIIALVPSFIVTLIFMQHKIVPQLNKTLTFISIWMVMPFYMVWKLIQKLGGK